MQMPKELLAMQKKLIYKIILESLSKILLHLGSFSSILGGKTGDLRSGLFNRLGPVGQVLTFRCQDMTSWCTLKQFHRQVAFEAPEPSADGGGVEAGTPRHICQAGLPADRQKKLQIIPMHYTTCKNAAYGCKQAH